MREEYQVMEETELMSRDGGGPLLSLMLETTLIFGCSSK
jgi:hypothetical protein